MEEPDADSHQRGAPPKNSDRDEELAGAGTGGAALRRHSDRAVSDLEIIKGIVAPGVARRLLHAYSGHDSVVAAFTRKGE